MTKLTIHTSSYNRGYILPRLYESLKAQTQKDFEWIITDDGSADNTCELVREWRLSDNGFDIVYNARTHEGIPNALNSGVALANAEWFMIIDSDDYILPETVEKVFGWIEEIKDLSQFSGVGFARCYPDGRYMKNQIPLIDPVIGYVDAGNTERAMYNLDMDMVEAYRTKLLKEYPFQCWPGETFAPEQLNLNAMSMAGYKVRWHADKLYICEYLDDGLTKSDTIVKNNPMGFAMMYNQNLLIHKGFKQKFRDAAQMTALSLYSGNKNYLKQTNSKFYTMLSYPVGVILSKRRKRQFDNM